jgi:hypothetical protein
MPFAGGRCLKDNHSKTCRRCCWADVLSGVEKGTPSPCPRRLIHKDQTTRFANNAMKERWNGMVPWPEDAVQKWVFEGVCIIRRISIDLLLWKGSKR